MSHFNSKDRILLIDDSPNNLTLLTEILEHEGYQVFQANRGNAGLDIAGKIDPTLILLDVRMPVMDGFTVCRHLKSHDELRHIPVIFISASDDTLDKAEGFNMGAVDYITRPFDASEVLARVKTHLTIRHTQKALETSNRQLERARNQVEKMNARLEARVLSRTNELETALLALKKSEERFREFVEGTDNLITRVDSQGNFIYVNHMAPHIFGVDEEDCIGRSAFAFVHPGDRVRTEEWFGRCITDQVRSATIENRQTHHNGKHHQVPGKRDLVPGDDSVQKEKQRHLSR